MFLGLVLNYFWVIYDANLSIGGLGFRVLCLGGELHVTREQAVPIGNVRWRLRK